MLNEAEATIICEQLSLLKFFPADEGSRYALRRLLKRMCEDLVKAQWLADRALDIFAEWPGPAELRALYTSRHRPVDGIEGHSINTKIYPELGEQRPTFLAASEAKAIDGRPVLQIEGPRQSEDFQALAKYEPELALAIVKCAEKKRLPEVKDIDYDKWEDPVAIKLRQMGL